MKRKSIEVVGVKLEEAKAWGCRTAPTTWAAS